MAPFVLDLKDVPVSPEWRKCMDGVLVECSFQRIWVTTYQDLTPPIRVFNAESSSHQESQAMPSIIIDRRRGLAKCDLLGCATRLWEPVRHPIVQDSSASYCFLHN